MQKLIVEFLSKSENRGKIARVNSIRIPKSIDFFKVSMELRPVVMLTFLDYITTARAQCIY